MRKAYFLVELAVNQHDRALDVFDTINVGVYVETSKQTDMREKRQMERVRTHHESIP
jgi:hypothetical protein